MPDDPVTLEVIRNALPAISTEMAVDLQRTSYRQIWCTRADQAAILLGA